MAREVRGKSYCIEKTLLLFSYSYEFTQTRTNSERGLFCYTSHNKTLHSGCISVSGYFAPVG